MIFVIPRLKDNMDSYMENYYTKQIIGLLQAQNKSLERIIRLLEFLAGEKMKADRNERL